MRVNGQGGKLKVGGGWAGKPCCVTPCPPPPPPAPSPGSLLLRPPSAASLRRPQPPSLCSIFTPSFMSLFMSYSRPFSSFFHVIHPMQARGSWGTRATCTATCTRRGAGAAAARPPRPLTSCPGGRACVCARVCGGRGIIIARAAHALNLLTVLARARVCMCFSVLVCGVSALLGGRPGKVLTPCGQNTVCLVGAALVGLAVAAVAAGAPQPTPVL